jgi:cephalosporin-C deacetylase
MDAEAYWGNLDSELARYPAAAEVNPLPRHSTDFADLYSVRLTSVGPYRIFGYLSVPIADGRWPALLETPRYGSVNHVPAYELRQRYVVLTVMHRGQRLADQPFAAEYPGLLTLDIEDAHRYIYRGIVADCLRAAEFLLAHPRVDPGRVAVVGDDLALITASRRPKFCALQVSELMFYRALEAAARTDTYPLEELNDILRTFPSRRQAIADTLALFDPLVHASGVTAATVLVGSEADSTQGLRPLAEALGGPVQVYRLTHEGRTDQRRLDDALVDRLRA